MTNTITFNNLALGGVTTTRGLPESPSPVGTTFDPVNKGSNTIISGEGLLVAACGNAPSVARSIGTIAEGSKTIWEFTHTADTWTPESEARCRMGFGTAAASLDLKVGEDTSPSLGLQNDGILAYGLGLVPGGDLGWGWIVGDTITFELERSGGDAIVKFYKNGLYKDSRTLAMPSGVWYAMVSNTVPIFTSTITANFSGPFQIEPTAGFGPIPV
jgi:hypothetical protein